MLTSLTLSSVARRWLCPRPAQPGLQGLVSQPPCFHSPGVACLHPPCRASPASQRVLSTRAKRSSASVHEDGELQKRAETLQALLEGYRKSYFSKGESQVSDDVYDALQRELHDIELQLGWQPRTKPLGAPILDKLQKAEHDLPMLSLAAVSSADELRGWRQRLDNHLNSSAVRESAGTSAAALTAALDSSSWVVEPKVDGLAVRLSYKGGRLVQAATRGDGLVGEDVTHNMSQIPGVVSHVEDCAVSDFEVRGEVFMTKESYRQVNEAQAAVGGERFSNPRNAAAGSLRLLDASASRSRRLSFTAYQLLIPGDTQQGGGEQGSGDALTGGGNRFVSHWEALQWLKLHGFPVSPDNCRAGTFVEAVVTAAQWMDGRDGLGYEVDGAVLKIDDLRLQSALGSVGADPRWAVAWKFPAAQALTKLLGVEMSLGRTGQLTPIALLEPVTLGGVTVQRASLHNVGLLAKLDLRVGDTVVVERAGDVIPQVKAPLPELRSGNEAVCEVPTFCPACGEAIAVEQSAVADVARCVNSLCAGQRERLLEHFTSTCVKGLGKSTVTQLLDCGLISDPADLYRLTAEQLQELEGYQATKAANHVAAVQASKGMSMATALTALGIPLIGQKAAEMLQDGFGCMEALAVAASEDLQALKGCGPKMAGSVRQWFDKEHNRRLVAKLQGFGAIMEEVNNHDKTSRGETKSPHNSTGSEGPDENASAALHLRPLEGMSVVVTGSYVERGSMTRKEVQELIHSLGGSLSQTVSSKTSLVVVGEKPGKRKVEKAQQHGVRMASEAEFWMLVDEEAQEATVAPPTQGKTSRDEADSPLNPTGNIQPNDHAENGGVSAAVSHLPLEGMSVVVAGRMARNDAKKIIHSLGGSLSDTVSSETSVVVVGARPGKRKVDKAEQHGVRIVSEAEFWEFVDEGAQEAAVPESEAVLAARTASRTKRSPSLGEGNGDGRAAELHLVRASSLSAVGPSRGPHR